MVEQQIYTEELTISYDSETNRANAEAVGSGLLAIQSVICEVQKAFDENEKILVKARPFAEGSLELPLELIVFGAAMILQEHPLLQKVREVITLYFDIKKRMRGRSIQVEDGNVVIIENSHVRVDQITLQCLNPGSEVSQRCYDAFQSIEKDQEIRAVRVYSSVSDEPIVDIQRDEFSYYHTDTINDEEYLGQKQEESRETLIIRQPAFDAELAWRFIWREMKISAKIQDQEFQQRVESGQESFVSGDSLGVTLLRLQEYDPAERMYVPKQYIITRVWEHNRRADIHQNDLFQ